MTAPVEQVTCFKCRFTSTITIGNKRSKKIRVCSTKPWASCMARRSGADLQKVGSLAGYINHRSWMPHVLGNIMHAVQNHVVMVQSMG